jgi:hypothetical protein
VLRNGEWQLLETSPAWDGDHAWQSVLAFGWTEGDKRLLVVVAFAPNQGQCYVKLQFPSTIEKIELRDRMSLAAHWRDRHALSCGIYLDLPSWGYHVFDLIPMT